jgi:hypothetical protein
MAITSFVKLTATAYALKYYIESEAGSSATQVVTKDDLIAALPPGPLRMFLAGLSSTEWQRVLRAPTGKLNDKLDVSALARSNGVVFTGPPPAVDFGVSGPDQILTIVMPNTASGAIGVVTLRYVHSQAR